MIFEARMNYLQKLASVIVVSFLLLGCVPFPTKNTEVPNVSGTLTDDGVGLSEYVVKIRYSSNDACSSNDSIAVITDSDGVFSFKSTYKWSMIRWAVPMDSIDYFNLCFIAPNGAKRWAYISHFRTPSWAPDINVSCKINWLLAEPKEIEGVYTGSPTCEKLQS